MLANLHTAIAAKIFACVPGLASCAAYPDLRGRVTLPAVLVELTDMEPRNQGGNELGLTARFSAFCIYDPNQAAAQIAVRELASSVAIVVHQAGNFAQAGVSSSDVIAVREDNFRPELEGYLVWAVEWEHTYSITAPTACAPEIGSYELHVQQYLIGGVDAPVATDNVTLGGNP